MFVFGFFLGLFTYSVFSSSSKKQSQLDIEDKIKEAVADKNKAYDLLQDAKAQAEKILALANEKIEKELYRQREKAEKDIESYIEKEKTKIAKERTRLNEDIKKYNNDVSTMHDIYFEKISYHSALEDVTNYWVVDSFDNILDALDYSNYATQLSKLHKIFEKCDKLGLEINLTDIKRFEKVLSDQHKIEIEKQKAKEEQNRIREIMKEEQRAEKVRIEELKRIEKEEKEIAKRKQENEQKLRHLQELEHLKKLTLEQLQELEDLKNENTQLEQELISKERAKSMAEQTKAGNVYVISNIGSFGDNIFKIGMTRRLIPEDRVKELGDASVPFLFDIHMMIPSENAPDLESKLHEELWNHRMNYVNNHKEFFKVTLEEIKKAVSKFCDKESFQCIDEAPALQWRESLKLKEMGLASKYETSVEDSDEDEVAA